MNNLDAVINRQLYIFNIFNKDIYFIASLKMDDNYEM
jgi:hypothetical protein